MKYFKIIVAVLMLSLWSCQSQKSENVELLDAKSFSEKIHNKEEVQLVDVRTPEEFKEQHIDNATNINWNDANFEQQVSNLDKSKPVYVYCKSGGRSAKATAKLSEMGFTNVYELDGGMLSWNEAKMPK